MKNYMKNFTSQAEPENGKPRMEMWGATSSEEA